MNKLTKGVLKEFIVNSEQSYIAGVFPVKFGKYTAYAEFLRKPMLHKKHKVGFLASHSEKEKKGLTLLAANYYTNGFRMDLIDSYIACSGLNNDETSGYWLADPDNWIEPVLQMRRYSNGHDNTKVAKDPREAVLENEAVKRLCRDKIEKIPKYVRLKKLIELAVNTAGTKLVVKYKTAEGEATTIASYRFRDLQDYQLIQQDGFYLRNGCLCLDPSSGMFITIDDALAFIPLDNVIGIKLPNEIVYP